MLINLSVTDIVDAMKNPMVSYKAQVLLGGKIILNGIRVNHRTGGYTTVFPFNTVNGEKIAVRAWYVNLEEGIKRTETLSKYLAELQCPYFVKFSLVKDALLIKGQTYPVTVMQWVEGQPLKDYINANISNTSKMVDLANRFKTMTEFLHQNLIAHGDLQHGNIMVKNDGSLVLIDYDSMYVNELNGMKDVIKGLPEYQHPARLNNVFVNYKLDYFSELVIYLSLIAYTEFPDLWNYETESLVFSKEDFGAPETSQTFLKLLQANNVQIRELTKKLVDFLNKPDIQELSPFTGSSSSQTDRIIREISNKF
ncbi:MAG: protein kinase domain-containing protein [Bacteroidia bacterium]